MTARLLWIESEKYIVLHGNKVCLFMFVVHVPFWGICNSFHWNRYSRQPAFFLFCSFLFAWNLCRGAPWRKLYANEYCMRREEMKCARREKERDRGWGLWKDERWPPAVQATKEQRKWKLDLEFTNLVFSPHIRIPSQIQNDLGASHFFFYVLLLLPFTIRNCFDSRYEVD